ncbi:unnamed protein product (macronuclear) [Paramecium tetraurelia]|uniref:Uncharacterized protein n=1 Tax=Paramecium tetraurelia TaxID=5888 RepID=A0BFA1_PARTE|nr:uncharacterized protein GSPATT00028253001 [Paramecium tetraurelia]CAK57218.1 unnamed protein product [Paramecium tetraurelia]|eukprot:XP_001424616.1 hypothetical protein (macronuclear) [Paramecium tetraurelia strain d4-2]
MCIMENQLIKFQKYRRISDGFKKFISLYQSRGGPKNQVLYDGDKRNSIRTYNDNSNTRQGFKIGWDIDQSRKGDTKIAGKVGQDQRNSYIPQYQTQTYVPVVEQNQDDDYMKQLYLQEMNKKQELAALYKQPEYNYQDALDSYNNGKQYSNNNNPSNTYEQPQLLQQSNKYDHYQQPNVEEELYYKYKQGNSGSKQQNTGKPPVASYHPITGQAYENAYTNQRVQEPQQQQQQDDALSQFSQLQQHKVTSMKNKTSNIFNTDIQETENINHNRQNSRVLNKRKEMDDAQYKGYGQFYKNPIDAVPTQYREQKFVNRNMIDNQIFPK